MSFVSFFCLFQLFLFLLKKRDVQLYSCTHLGKRKTKHHESQKHIDSIAFYWPHIITQEHDFLKRWTIPVKNPKITKYNSALTYANASLLIVFITLMPSKFPWWEFVDNISETFLSNFSAENDHPSLSHEQRLQTLPVDPSSAAWHPIQDPHCILSAPQLLLASAPSLPRVKSMAFCTA